MKYLRQVAAPVGAFLALAMLISVLAAPYFREAERQASAPETHFSRTVARVQ
jgi:hypothetical protein